MTMTSWCKKRLFAARKHARAFLTRLKICSAWLLSFTAVHFVSLFGVAAVDPLHGIRRIRKFCSETVSGYSWNHIMLLVVFCLCVAILFVTTAKNTEQLVPNPSNPHNRVKQLDQATWMDKLESDPQLTDCLTAYKRRFIRKMMKHAWDGYAKYAFGANEVAPVSKQPYLTGTFGRANLGATIVDALDTLWIMGLRDEFDRGRQWVAQDFNLSNQDVYLSLFETNIRFLGGLLSAFSLSGDQMFLRKAYQLGQTLMSAFNTSSGIPWRVFNFKNKSNGESVTFLADIGTFHLEFAYLSNLTDNPVFVEKATHIRDVLDKLDKSPDGLYRDHIVISTENWSGERDTNLGSLGDSFYEYLFKSWLWSNRTDTTAKRMFDEAMQAVQDNLITTTADGKHFVFLRRDDSGQPSPVMEHLTCFMGGLYALSVPYADNPTQYALQAAQVAETCQFASTVTKTGFAPESFRLGIYKGEDPVKPLQKEYLLRPEIAETYFVLWRKTRDPVYRQWGWALAQAIETYCRAEAGYSGLRNVDRIDPTLQDDVQQSFFLAETLKYLYLLFVDNKNDNDSSTAADDGGIDISLDDYVFNTEAHPLPIFGSRKSPNVKRLLLDSIDL